MRDGTIWKLYGNQSAISGMALYGTCMEINSLIGDLLREMNGIRMEMLPTLDEEKNGTSMEILSTLDDEMNGTHMEMLPTLDEEIYGTHMEILPTQDEEMNGTHMEILPTLDEGMNGPVWKYYLLWIRKCMEIIWKWRNALLT